MVSLHVLPGDVAMVFFAINLAFYVLLMSDVCTKSFAEKTLLGHPFATDLLSNRTEIQIR
jgi:hypothetical protein